MVKNIIPLFFSLLILASCSNKEFSVETANFKVSAETVFLDESCTFEADDQLGEQNYNWDFGDGTILKSGYTVTHQFLEEGTFTSRLFIDGMTHSNTIHVLPGRFSYQILNNSIYMLNILVYIDNYETGCTKRMYINQNEKSDTIYATSNHGFMVDEFKFTHIFGISIFIENSEYTFANVPMVDDFEHHSIAFSDSTYLVPRSSHGLPKEVMLKDLFPN